MWCGCSRTTGSTSRHGTAWRDVLLVVLTAEPPRAPSAPPRAPRRAARAARAAALRAARPRYPIRLGRRSRSVRERVCRAVTTYDTSSAPSNQHASTPASDHTAANDPPYIVCRIASTE